jgi:hypothetical protein
MRLLGPGLLNRPEARLARGPIRANGGMVIFRNAAIRAEIKRMRPLFAIVLWVAGAGLAAADQVPLPRPRPAVAAAPSAPATFAEAASGLDLAAITSDPTPCDRRLEGVAAITLRPRLIGPGACGGADMIELQAVLLPDETRVDIRPAATVRCDMAESLAAWLREEAAPRLAEKLGSPLNAVENYDSYSCRSRNRIAGAKLSEHARGNAIDVRAFYLADGRLIALTDVNVDGPLREGLRDSACHRFPTVLGPGDPFHSGHIHLDVLERRGGFRMCQWEVRGPSPPAVAIPLPRPRPVAANAPR